MIQNRTDEPKKPYAFYLPTEVVERFRKIAYKKMTSPNKILSDLMKEYVIEELLQENTIKNLDHTKDNKGS